jgi:hypothetical protein
MREMSGVLLHQNSADNRVIIDHVPRGFVRRTSGVPRRTEGESPKAAIQSVQANGA